MTKNTRRNTGGTHIACRCIYAIPVLLAALLSPSQGRSQQNSEWYQFNDDVKNYSTTIEPGNNRASAMAGTIFNGNGFGSIHFMRLDNGPSPYYYPKVVGTSPAISRKYDELDYYDSRTVDIDNDGNKNNYITALVREQPVAITIPYSGPVYRDKIKVMKVNQNGTVVAQTLIYDNTAMPAGQYWGYSMYPLNAFYKSGVINTGDMSSHDVLYVCGFMTTDNTIGQQNYPTFQTPKKAFIVSIDVTTTSWSIINARYFDAPVSATTNSPELDFDIAHRIQEITLDPNFAGNICVMGSLTAVTGINNGPPQAYTHVRSGTMVRVLDPWSLAVRASSQFIVAGNGDGYGGNEYGLRLVEKYDGTNYHYYCVGNSYTYLSFGNGTTANDWENALGFNDEVTAFHITHLSNFFIFASPRLKYNINGWANDVLETATLGATGNISERTFLIGGMAWRHLAGQTHTVNPTKANITPFLFDVDVEFTGGMLTDQASNRIAYYPNQTGTGNPSSFNNTYADLGDGLSYVAWTPTFAARENTSSDIVLNSPKWDPNMNRLGLKTLFADGTTLDMNSSDCPVDIFPLQGDPEDVESCAGTSEIPNIDLAASNTLDNDYPFTEAGDCLDYAGTGNHAYRPTAISNTVKRSNHTNIYPNPAHDVLNVSLAADIAGDADVEVAMVNMYGQKVANLYKGTANGLLGSIHLKLPQVADGVYFIHITANGKLVLKEKLAVQ